jgi:hypothetical protein
LGSQLYKYHKVQDNPKPVNLKNYVISNKYDKIRSAKFSIKIGLEVVAKLQNTVIVKKSMCDDAPVAILSTRFARID